MSNSNAAGLRKRAEEEAAQSPKETETLSPAATRQTLHELRVHQIELEMQNAGLRRMRDDLDAARARYFALYDLAPVGYCTLSEKGLLLEANLTLATLLGVARSALDKQPAARFVFEEDQGLYFLYRKTLFEKGTPQSCELRLVKRDGTAFWAHLEATAAQDLDGGPVCRIALNDITGRKRSEACRDMGLDVLRVLNQSGGLRDTMRRVLAVMKEQTGFDAVGLRLQDGEDFPYFDAEGFPADFLLTENTLASRGPDGGVCRDKDGKVCLECTCGLVISGRTDPAHPLFTRAGSFWTNDSAPLLDLPPEQDPRHHPRNTCFHQGYASVALIPVRDKERIVGLLHLNARRKGCFTLATVKILEDLASHIGEALMRKRAEEALRAREQEFRAMFEVASIGMAQADPHTQHWLRVNAKMCAITGYSADEMLKMRIPELTHPADRQQDLELFLRVVRGEAPDYRMEKRYLRKDGTVAWVNVNMTVIRDAASQPVRTMATIEDITERMRAEADREQAAAQLQQKMDELQRWQTVTLGREGRIGELKNEVNELSARLGEPPPYGAPENVECKENR